MRKKNPVGDIPITADNLNREPRVRWFRFVRAFFFFWGRKHADANSPVNRYNASMAKSFALMYAHSSRGAGRKLLYSSATQSLISKEDIRLITKASKLKVHQWSELENLMEQAENYRTKFFIEDMMDRMQRDHLKSLFHE
jgi:hypothetical protein